MSRGRRAIVGNSPAISSNVLTFRTMRIGFYELLMGMSRSGLGWDTYYSVLSRLESAETRLESTGMDSHWLEPS